MVRVKQYVIDDKQNKVQFIPEGQLTWNRELSNIELFEAAWFVDGSLYFRGSINLEKLIKAFQNTLHIFEWLFLRLYFNAEKIVCAYPLITNENSANIDLAIEYQTDEVNNIDIFATIPPTSLIMKNGKNDPAGIPMATFKITICRDGFILAYCFSHVFVDQASIVYFLRYLSRHYSNKSPLALPRLINFDKQFAHAIKNISFNTIDEIEAQAKILGLRYGYPRESSFQGEQLPSAVYLYFDRNKLREYKSNFAIKISTTDIINAILLKIFAYKNELNKDLKIHLNMTINMRKYCGLGEEVMGNIRSFSFAINPLTFDQIVNATILELAEISRDCVNHINKELYLNQIAWFYSLTKFNLKPAHYAPLAIVRPNFWGQNNQASFNYEDISFDNHLPYAFRVLPVPLYSAKIPTFRFDEYDGQPCLAVQFANLSGSQLDFINQLKKETGLFHTTDINETE